MLEVLAEVYRGDSIESIHYGSIVVVDNNGRVVYYAGDPEFATYIRSALKPMQVVPFLESGGFEHFGFDLTALAIMCGSHAGSELHVSQVSSNLAKIGLDESYLLCGTHPPIEYASQGILPRREETFSPLQHNCSGKHSGMLAFALYKGLDPKRYMEFDEEPQLSIRKAVLEICEISEDRVNRGIDGCSLPNYHMPLRNFAHGFANIGTLKADQPERRKAFAMIIKAMQTHPILVSGDKRSDYLIQQALPTEVICKLGGESIQGVALIKQGWGMAVKIADGNFRALGPVVVEALRQLEVLPDSRLEHVKPLIRPEIRNNRDLLTGHIQPVFKLKKA